MKQKIPIVTRTKKILQRTEAVKKETGIRGYKDLVTTQEIIREVGRYLDKFVRLAPEMEMFAIDTPRNSFTILLRKRTQTIH